MTHRLRNPLSRVGLGGQLQDQRDPDLLFGNPRPMIEDPGAFGQGLAMIRNHDDQRLVISPTFPEGVQKLPSGPVGVRDFTVITPDPLFQAPVQLSRTSLVPEPFNQLVAFDGIRWPCTGLEPKIRKLFWWVVVKMRVVKVEKQKNILLGPLFQEPTRGTVKGRVV